MASRPSTMSPPGKPGDRPTSSSSLPPAEDEPAPLSNFAQWVQRVILALGVTVGEKELQLAGMVEEATTDTVFGSLSLVFMILQQNNSDTRGSLCLYYLENVLYAHPNALALYFTPDMVPILFSTSGDGGGDDLRAGVLLWRLLKYKYESSGQTYPCELEAYKLLRILEKRNSTKVVRKFSPSCIRYILVKIWADIEPSRRVVEKLSDRQRREDEMNGKFNSPVNTKSKPQLADDHPADDLSFVRPKKQNTTAVTNPTTVMLDVCMHWLAETEEPPESKAPLLELLRSVVKGQSAVEMTSQLLTRFFALLSSTAVTGSLSDDLQFSLALVDWAEIGAILPALLQPFGEDKLVAIWTFLCTMHPVKLPEPLQINPSWHFFKAEQPLIRFQKLLAQHFFQRSYRLGGSALAVLLSLATTEQTGVVAVRLLDELGVAGNYETFLRALREKAAIHLEVLDDDDEEEKEEGGNFYAGGSSMFKKGPAALIQQIDVALGEEQPAPPAANTSSFRPRSESELNLLGRKIHPSDIIAGGGAATSSSAVFGNHEHRPNKLSALFSECFQSVPNAARNTFLLQKQNQHLLAEKLRSANQNKLKQLNQHAVDRGTLELNELFRENLALTQQISWKQMEIANENLKSWEKLQKGIEEEERQNAASPKKRKPAPLPAQYRFISPAEAGPQIRMGLPDDSASVQFGQSRSGIRNSNNTCFVNTVLQALFHTDAFVSTLFRFRLRQPDRSVDEAQYQLGAELLRQLQFLFGMLLITARPHVDIESLLSVLPSVEFPKGEQQDAGEFLRFLFDKLGGFQQGLIRQSFAGELSEVTKCADCGYEKRRPETFTEIILPVPDVPGKSVQQLLGEKLDRKRMQDALTCSQCGSKNCPETWSEIRSPPRQLVIALIRFDFRMDQGGLVKLKTPVQISQTLQLGQFAYEFYFSIQHCGATADSGHYTAFGKRSDVSANAGGGTTYWKFDDSQVKPSSWAELQQMASGSSDDTPYLLFYRCASAPVEPDPLLPAMYLDMLQQEDRRQIQMTS
ncbi:unnamed protein product [Amoebophrya sp. A120]|nr:unnamed protein product [Amoebophrya sp. A120]|eukprot:GSA120T00003160001.1